MHIKRLFEEKEVVFSFEIFPPKLTSPIETIYGTIDALSELRPDFISVTYGAGGSSTVNRTAELSSLVKNKYGIEALSHLTCIGSSEESVNCILNELKAKGIENILALRGDIPEGSSNIGNFKSAHELIKHIIKEGEFGISGACYPEGHAESSSLNEHIEFLKRKVDVGAEHLITQLFFDNSYLYKFLNKAAQNGINVPVQAGIMPVTNKKQIEKIVSLCGTALPSKFIKIMNRYEHDKEALRDAGIAFAIDQIVDLISTGVRGIHLYTMNSPYVAAKITESIGSLISSVNRKQAG
jgi:methylenetetrahydrofolate reductase (NADPH)